MNYLIDDKVLKQLKALKKKDSKLVEKIRKQLLIFEKDPKHPSLSTHKLKGNLGDSWSISIARDMRMVYRLVNTEDGKRAYFYACGTHDQVYE